MNDSQSSHEIRMQQRYVDLQAINDAQKRLKDAKVALRLANRKRDRRVARVQAALKALEESLSEIENKHIALKVAQKINDRAFQAAAQNRLKELEIADAPQL